MLLNALISFEMKSNYGIRADNAFNAPKVCNLLQCTIHATLMFQFYAQNDP